MISSPCIEGEPTFLMATDFGKQNSLKQRTSCSADNIPTSALNFEQLGIIVGLTRDIAEKIITKFIYVLGRSVREGRKVSLLFHKIAAVTIENGEFKCDFMAEFISDFKSPVIGTSAGRGLGFGLAGPGPMTPGKSSRNSRSVDVRTLQNTSSNAVIKPNPDRTIRSSSANRGGSSRSNDRVIGNYDVGGQEHRRIQGQIRSGNVENDQQNYQRPLSSESMRSRNSNSTGTSRSSTEMNTLLNSPSGRNTFKNNLTENSRIGALRKENLEILQRQQRGQSAGSLKER